ncbi:MAG: ferredoxin [Pseudomonadota bacterium]
MLTECDALLGQISRAGLHFFGAFEFELGLCRKGEEHFVGRQGLLVGNAGPRLWSVFSQSEEYLDGLPDPMNRWTARVLRQISSDHFLDPPVFPFDEPYWPFQRMLAAATGMRQSPLGLFIHPEFGLWQAVRGVLVLPQDRKFVIPDSALADIFERQNHPCDVCKTKPCLSACPVDAFDGKSLSVASCHAHLSLDHGPRCMTLGCRARDACPVGSQHRYDSGQVQFHMKAYGPKP